MDKTSLEKTLAIPMKTAALLKAAQANGCEVHKGGHHILIKKNGKLMAAIADKKEQGRGTVLCIERNLGADLDGVNIRKDRQPFNPLKPWPAIRKAPEPKKAAEIVPAAIVKSYDPVVALEKAKAFDFLMALCKADPFGIHVREENGEIFLQYTVLKEDKIKQCVKRGKDILSIVRGLQMVGAH